MATRIIENIFFSTTLLYSFVENRIRTGKRFRYSNDCFYP
ncbi:hypothetical protein BACCAP_04095 [Pseudoflavonifractor capillosus ATCC 29799]|uniref:Uncharacterized protein n=1 Tax=Pseudoflavonifractor capillosus ATCC 29799 TaxID=411467 RepID=A6P0S9_9FIRM|nr:hypothetical protein BACCAP_04095 [Pseudoflavonifractor capillosus ATCC 29799]